ncbi:MAG TPA: hypothetical protein VKT75_13095 [Acidobacteriaceae bacterium]|nr:hypothetical protein [Acidobacteriaceae bacterium]
MSSNEWKSRFAVIERLRLTPLHDRMAAIATLAEPAAMRLDFAVAFDAAGWCFAKFDLSGVAALTGGVPMGTHELVVGGIVVECFTIHLIDIGFTPFVFAMAFPAILR